MLSYFVLNYLALSALFAFVFFEMGTFYTFGATLVLLALTFLGPKRLKAADLKAEVPKSQYWWLILFVGFLFLTPFLRVSYGKDFLNLPVAALKIVVSVGWIVATVFFLRGLYFAIVRDKA